MVVILSLLTAGLLATSLGFWTSYQFQVFDKWQTYYDAMAESDQETTGKDFVTSTSKIGFWLLVIVCGLILANVGILEFYQC